MEATCTKGIYGEKGDDKPDRTLSLGALGAMLSKCRCEKARLRVIDDAAERPAKGL